MRPLLEPVRVLVERLKPVLGRRMAMLAGQSGPIRVVPRFFRWNKKLGCCVREGNGLPQSQRDWIIQPKVGPIHRGPALGGHHEGHQPGKG